MLTVVLNGLDVIGGGSYTSTNFIPLWIWPIIIIYLIGSGLMFKARNRTKKWWKQVLFVIFWPWFLIVFLFRIAQFATDG